MPYCQQSHNKVPAGTSLYNLLASSHVESYVPAGVPCCGSASGQPHKTIRHLYVRGMVNISCVSERSILDIMTMKIEVDVRLIHVQKKDRTV